MAVLLGDIPDHWGPKYESGGVAATRTRVGPNEIFLRPLSHMALVLFTPQPGRLVSLNSDRRVAGLAPAGALEIIPTGSDFSARWLVDKENLLVALEPRHLARLAGLEFGRTDFGRLDLGGSELHFDGSRDTRDPAREVSSFDTTPGSSSFRQLAPAQKTGTPSYFGFTLRRPN